MLEQIVPRTLNHLLRHATWAHERLRGHAGRHCRVETGPLTLDLLIDEHGTFTVAGSPSAPDVTITLPADAPFRLLTDKEAVFAHARLSGSVDLAEDLAFVFRNLSWDVEDDLAQFVGDIAAHRLIRLGRHFGQTARDGFKRAVDNVVDYTTLESGQIIEQGVFTDFSRQVSSLRDDLARLEKRIARL